MVTDIANVWLCSHCFIFSNMAAFILVDGPILFCMAKYLQKYLSYIQLFQIMSSAVCQMTC